MVVTWGRDMALVAVCMAILGHPSLMVISFKITKGATRPPLFIGYYNC